MTDTTTTTSETSRGVYSEVSRPEVEAELARILNSELFLKSPQLSRFLRFCVDETLAGQQDCLKEQVLGTDVFRRPTPFDPRLDPIVRVEARRLRSKLDQYYGGEGATNPVMITFRRGDYTPRFVRAASDGPIPAAKSAKVLIVEDERLVARDLENRLKNLGYEVVGSVSSGEAALAAVDTAGPNIVLMDIVLSGSMRGTEAARRIWSGWRIPVVYLTAFSDALVLEDVKGSDPYGYILKPFDSKQLHAVLQLAISRRDREAAETSVNRELAHNERLIAALINAQIRPLDWIVRDPSAPLPEAAETPSEPAFSTADLTPVRFFERILAADRERVQAALTQAVRTKSPFEVRYRRTKNGTHEWVVATGAVEEDASGRLRCTGLEIGAASAMPLAESKVAELEQFVRAAGHDLQEPLRTVKTYTQLLSRHQGRTEDSAPETLLNYIEGGVDQMHALITNLLTYTAIAGEQPPETQSVPLDEPVDIALQNLQVALMESGTQVTRSDLPVVRANTQHMVQLFQNLISNAIKYRQEGTNPEINISAAPCGEQWRICVRDNGVGFEADNADQIFQAFKRLSSRATPGTGLGLAICRRIVEMYGGRIWAESNPDEGSVFQFTLPRG